MEEEIKKTPLPPVPITGVEKTVPIPEPPPFNKSGIIELVHAVGKSIAASSFEPIYDYFKKKGPFMKYVFKYQPDILIFFVIASLIIGYFCCCSYYKKGWHDSQVFNGDKMQMQLASGSTNDREKIYQDWLNAYDGNSPELGLRGEEAFKMQDWNWSVTFFKACYNNKGMFDDNPYQSSPIYVAALIQLNQTDEAAKQIKITLRIIDNDLEKNTGSLRIAENLGGMLTRLSDARKVLRSSDQHYLDTFRTEIKNRLNDKRVITYNIP
jgi:hypothetical protein